MPESVPVPELSQNEKGRRWSLVRDKLKKNGLSALIVYGGSQLGVPLHYHTGMGHQDEHADFSGRH